MVVQHNLTAMNANRYLGINNNKLAKSLEKLSSGYAINRAGDNAAGLAVSEKMRSQIAGMQQGVKNAQDGISMVQTFEGALTETDSILQRMKTLADQMANGTYDDPVDRTAAQQEFLQLNDELDQIADTDFNGVVVLNGGVMSDGTTAAGVTVSEDANGNKVKTYDNTVDNAGLIDYRAAKKAAAAAAADAAAAAPADISGDGVEKGKIIDNSKYDKTVADDVYEKVGVDPAKYDKIQVTYQYDGKEWKGIAVTDEDGAIIDGADASGLAATNSAVNGNDGKGGFVISAGGQDMACVFDMVDVEGKSREAVKGDTVTLSFENNADKTYAPNNVGVAESSLTVPDELKAAKPAPKFTLDAGITTDNMTAEVAADLDELKSQEFKITFTDGDVADLDADITAGTLTLDNKDDSGVTTDANGIKSGIVKYDVTGTNGTKLGTIEIDVSTLTADTPATDATATVTDGGNGGGDQAVTVANQATLNGATAAKWSRNGAGTWSNDKDATTYASDAAFGTALGLTLTGTWGNGDTIDIVAAAAAGNGPDTDADGDIKFKIDVDAYNVADTTTPLKAESVATPDAAKKAAEEALSADGYEVSVSNAFNNSEAMMTYKDSIILQAGARTKDAVEFTFKYASTAIGDLKPDLDCTANGLGTDKLNLSTQEAANYAVDKIDQAINKVSLVRGTFGAIQNRLEHKIDNLNVSVENLTSAESQIRDTNMPQEMMNFTKQQILAQASQSMLAQANQLPQGVLSLLQ